MLKQPPAIITQGTYPKYYNNWKYPTFECFFIIYIFMGKTKSKLECVKSSSVEIRQELWIFEFSLKKV